MGTGDCRPGICWMISLAPFAISQRLQPPDKLLVSVRGNGIQRPGEALSVSRSLSQIRQQEETQLVSRAPSSFFKKRTFNWPFISWLQAVLQMEEGCKDLYLLVHTFLTPTHWLSYHSPKYHLSSQLFMFCPPKMSCFWGATELPPPLLLM